MEKTMYANFKTSAQTGSLLLLADVCIFWMFIILLLVVPPYLDTL